MGATSFNSAGLSGLATVTAPDIAVVVLDPLGASGAPEVVYVTAHSSSATTATITRAQEGTTARQMPTATAWVHAATLVDFGTPTAVGTQTLYNPIDPWINVKSFPAAATSTITVGNGTAYLVPLEPIQVDTQITKIRFKIGTQSGNMDVGVYHYDGTTFTRIVSAGSTATPATGINDITVTSTTLYRGVRYYVAIAFDNGTATITGLTFTLSTVPGFLKATSFVLPATITTPSAITPAYYPFMALQVTGGISL